MIRSACSARLGVALPATALGILFMPLSVVAVQAAVNLDQVRNGGATDPTDPGAWQNGNLNATQAHYVEGWSTAYRAVLTDLPVGTPVTLTLGYDIKHSDTHALDYLTHYDRLEPHLATFAHEKETLDPLAGTGILASAPMSTFAIPAPGSTSSPVAGQPSASFNALPSGERVMTMWNGTLDGIAYVTEGSLTASQAETQISVTFTPSASTAVLAWGGHIASRRDWGFHADGTPRSAAGINGSPYHMRVIGWSLGNLGQQDRSLAAAAVFPPPMCELTGQDILCEGDSANYFASTDDPSATLQWSLSENTAGATFVGSATDTVATVATSQSGSFRLQLTITALSGTSTCDTLVTVNELATADAGADQAVCSLPAPLIALAGSIGGGATTALWTTSGTGTFGDAGDPTTTYTPSAADIAAGAVTLTLSTEDPSGPCGGATDGMVLTITEAATVAAGGDQIVCSVPAPLIELSGSFGGGATSVGWTTSGSGSFGNALDPVTTYLPSAADIAAGSVTFRLTTDDPGDPCGAAVDELVVTIRPAATADAGDDLSVCSLPAPVVTLAGSFGGGASGATWTTSGSGTFGNPVHPGTTYTPSAADIEAGSVTLTLTTNDPSGPCERGSDEVVLTIFPAATVDAGSDLAFCSDPVPLIALAGSFGGGASAVTWSTSGSGTFADPADPTTTYLPSAADIALGHVTLTLATNDPGGPCGAASDGMRITIAPAATANAGANQTVCSLPAPAIELAGSIGGGATAALWTTSGSGLFDDPADAATIYRPSPADIAAGAVTLTLTTDDPTGSCGSASDAMVVSIRPAATVDAGSDQSVCAVPPPVVTVTGSFGGGAASVLWTTSGTGTFADATDPTTTYTPSAADIADGGVTLTLATDNPDGPCGAASDELSITIAPAASVDAGDDQADCAIPAPVFDIAGSLGGSATSATWSSSGTGTFGHPNALATTYTPSAADLASGSVTLTLTTNDPDGPCAATSDKLVLTIHPAPDCNLAYPDVLPFAGSTGNELSGPPGMVSYFWTVSGNGHLQGGQGTDTITYSVGPSLGAIHITLTMTDPNGCEGTCELDLYCVIPGSSMCTLTQGFYGNPGGKFNGEGTLRLIQRLLATPIVLGQAGRSLTIPLESAHCIIERLPTGTTPYTLPAGFGDQTMDPADCQTDPAVPVNGSGKWENVLLGQTLALSLNVRLSPDLLDYRLCHEFTTVRALPGPDGILGTEDDVASGDPDDMRTWTIPQSVLDALGANRTVADLLVLANSALAAGAGGDILSDINHAVSTINEAFDQCRFVVDDCRVPIVAASGKAPGPASPGDGDAAAAPAETPLQSATIVATDVPAEFALHGSRPNPIRATAEIRFDLPTAATVALEIFDVTGRRVRALENGPRAAGRHAAMWDARNDQGARVAAGIYFYRIQAGAFREIRKLTVLR